MKFKTGTTRARDIDLDAIDFAVDTALSWDGSFPEAGKGEDCPMDQLYLKDPAYPTHRVINP